MPSLGGTFDAPLTQFPTPAVFCTILIAVLSPFFMYIFCYMVTSLAQHSKQLAPLITNRTIKNTAEGLEILSIISTLTTCALILWELIKTFPLFRSKGAAISAYTELAAASGLVVVGLTGLSLISLHAVEIVALKPDQLPTSLAELFSYEPLSGIKDLSEYPRPREVMCQAV